MLDRLANRIGAWRFGRLVPRVLDTPPLRIRDAPLRFVSMVSHKDLHPYLLAIKSIYRFVGEGRIVVINDGSLTAADFDMLRVQVGDPDVVEIGAIPVHDCPSGGCWERLTFICGLAADNYVMQVDSDLLAVAAIPEVVDAYRRNVAFTQAGDLESRVGGVRDAADAADRHPSRHVQNISEQSLRGLSSALGQHYVRGSAGFAGFPRGQDLRPTLRAFSAEMSRLVGSRWVEWGTEQVTSNYIVANCPGAVVLPPERYSIHCDTRKNEPARLIHFFGPFRFRYGNYVRHGRRVLEELGQKVQQPGHAR